MKIVYTINTDSFLKARLVTESFWTNKFCHCFNLIRAQIIKCDDDSSDCDNNNIIIIIVLIKRTTMKMMKMMMMMMITIILIFLPTDL